MITSDAEKALLLEALARQAVHVRACIDTCQRDAPGLPPVTPGVLAAYREDLAQLDQLYSKILAEDLRSTYRASQIASISTSAPNVRNEIDGWTVEDPSLLVRRSHSSNPRKIFIGFTPSPKDIPLYTCVLEMLADGWELLAPPTREEWPGGDGASHEQWSWWLRRAISAAPASDLWRHARPMGDEAPTEDGPSMTARDIARLAEAVRGQVAKFSDHRMNDGDDIWRERELELRDGVAATANALCVALKLDAKTFAAACGLHVSDGRDTDTYSDCRPGELSWEKPREDAP